MTTTTTTVSITTYDNVVELGPTTTFVLTKEAANESKTLKDLLEQNDYDGEVTIPLQNVKSATFEKVKEYLDFHQTHGSADELKAWDTTFCSSMEMEPLFQLILAANYLDIKPLLDLLTKAVADMIKGKKPSEIKELFGVTRAFTLEEEAQVIAENPWMVEDEAKP